MFIKKDEAKELKKKLPAKKLQKQYDFYSRITKRDNKAF